MRIARDIVIDLDIEEVFEFVADPRGDPRWCPRVLSVDQVAGRGPGAGAVYHVVHRPVPFGRPRRMTYTCVDWEAPVHLAWLEDDGPDLVRVTYDLERVWTATRLIQRDFLQLRAPRVLHPLIRIARDRLVARQLRDLRRVLERG